MPSWTENEGSRTGSTRRYSDWGTILNLLNFVSFLRSITKIELLRSVHLDRHRSHSAWTRGLSLRISSIDQDSDSHIVERLLLHAFRSRKSRRSLTSCLLIGLYTPRCIFKLHPKDPEAQILTYSKYHSSRPQIEIRIIDADHRNYEKTANEHKREVDSLSVDGMHHERAARHSCVTPRVGARVSMQAPIRRSLVSVCMYVF